MSGEVTAFPLCWPPGKKRHRDGRRAAAFKTNYDRTVREIQVAVRRLGGTELLVSSDMPVRRDGFPMSNRSTPKDPGVAVYFKRKGKSVCFA